MFHTINPAIVRQLNELSREPTKDKQLQKIEEKVIGKGLTELVDKLKTMKVKNPRKI